VKKRREVQFERCNVTYLGEVQFDDFSVFFIQYFQNTAVLSVVYSSREMMMIRQKYKKRRSPLSGYIWFVATTKIRGDEAHYC
jgi:hypothetical protein